MIGVNADEALHEKKTYLLYPVHFSCQHKVIGSSLDTTTTTPCMCLLLLPAAPIAFAENTVFSAAHEAFSPINNISLDSEAKEWAAETLWVISFGFCRALASRWGSMQTHSWNCQVFIHKQDLWQMSLRDRVVKRVRSFAHIKSGMSWPCLNQ